MIFRIFPFARPIPGQKTNKTKPQQNKTYRAARSHNTQKLYVDNSYHDNSYHDNTYQDNSTTSPPRKLSRQLPPYNQHNPYYVNYHGNSYYDNSLITAVTLSRQLLTTTPVSQLFYHDNSLYHNHSITTTKLTTTTP